jgi:hypothetical protein
MKFLISALLIILAHPAFGQFQNNILRLDYSDTSGEEGFTTYVYNGKPHPYKAIWELKDGSRWSVNYHEFDSNGNMIRKYREFSDSITTLQEFYYNSDNKLARETFLRSDGVSGTVNYLYSENRLSTADCKGLNGWFHGTIIFKYRQREEKPFSAILQKDGEDIGNITYRYNNSQLETETWTFRTGFIQNFVYSYIDSNNIHYKSSNVFIRDNYPWVVSEENYDYSGQGGGPSYYTYDENGKLLEKVFVRSDGLKTTTDFHYLENGLLEKSVRHYSDGKTGIFSYIYDSNRNLVERNFRRSDGITGNEKYHFDKDGKLISGEWFNFDNWLTGLLEFGHDRYDRPVNASFINTENKAHIIFEYDLNGNLTRIYWEFDKGASQAYKFSYKTIGERGK